jgi:hypothetical protein
VHAYLANGRLYILNMKTKLWDSVAVGATEDSGESSSNIDGGDASSIYGGLTTINGGSA